MTESTPSSAKKIQPDLTNAVWQSAHDESGEPPPPPGGGRIEIAFVEDKICMRNGEDPDGPVLTFTEAEWDAFIGGVQDGEFDLDENMLVDLPTTPPTPDGDSPRG